MVPVPLAHLVGGVVGTGIGLVKDKAIAKRFIPQARNRHAYDEASKWLKC